MNRPAEDRLFDLFRRRGDVTALAKVFDATSPELARVARHLCRNIETAEDAVQSTFLAAIDAPDEWDASRPLVPWLLGLLTNRVREQRRQDARRPRPDRVAEPMAAEDPLEAASRSEVSAEVRSALEALDQPFRDALERRLFHLQSAEEIARDLGIAAGTVRMRIHRGMDRLRQRLPASLAPAASAPALAGLSMGALERIRSSVLQAAETGRAATVAAGSASVPAFTWTAFLSLFAMHKPILLTTAGFAAVAFAALQIAPLFGAAESHAPRLSSQIVERIADSDPEPGADRGAAEAPRRRPLASAANSAEQSGEIVLTVRGDDAALDRLRIEIVAESAMPYGDALAVGSTDIDGVFTTRIPAGRVAIRVPALDEPHAASLSVPPGARVRADLDLPVQVVAKVTVLDGTGRPLAGAQITGRTSVNRWATATEMLGVTRQDGSWEHAFVSRQVEIRAHADGYAQSDSHKVGKAPIEIRLQSGPGGVSGTVYGTDGAPAPDAEVALLTESERHLQSRPQGVRCDAQGRYHFNHLPAGTITLVATRWYETSRGSASQLARTEVQVVAGRPTVADLHFGLDTGAARVEVRDASGTPLPHVQVSLVYFGRELPGFLSSRAGRDELTDERGLASISGLVPGTYQLQCSPGGRRITRDLQVLAGETTAVVASLAPSSDLEFVVLDESRRPLEGMVVSLTPATGGRELRGTTDATGRARFQGVNHGDHALQVHAGTNTEDGRNTALLERSLAVTGPVVEELRVDLSSLSQLDGLVTTDGRIPLDGLEARLLRLTDQERLTIRLDADAGAREVPFHFDGVPPGTWLLSVRRQDQDLAIVESIEVTGIGARIDVGTLALGLGSTTLELSRTDGESVRDAVLVVRIGELDLRRIGLPPQTDRIRLVDLPAFAPAEAFVWGPEVAPTRVALRVVAGESLQIPVALQPGTRTTLVLPAAETTLPVRQGTYEWTRNGAPFFRERVLDGDRLTRGLPPGSYRIAFEPLAGQRRATASFEVGTAPLEVELAWQ